MKTIKILYKAGNIFLHSAVEMPNGSTTKDLKEKLNATTVVIDGVVWPEGGINHFLNEQHEYTVW